FACHDQAGAFSADVFEHTRSCVGAISKDVQITIQRRIERGRRIIEPESLIKARNVRRVRLLATLVPALLARITSNDLEIQSRSEAAFKSSQSAISPHLSSLLRYTEIVRKVVS